MMTTVRGKAFCAQRMDVLQASNISTFNFRFVTLDQLQSFEQPSPAL
jgi:hypothetical protein